MKVEFNLFSKDILLSDPFKMFKESPRLKLRCAKVNDILLTEEHKNAMKIHFSTRNYHLAIRLWLRILSMKDLIKNNRSELLQTIEHCEKIGMISKRSKKSLERFSIMKRTINICGRPLEICFSESRFEKFLRLGGTIIKTENSTETFKSYLRAFKKANFLKSKTFRENLRLFVKQFKHSEFRSFHKSAVKNFKSVFKRKKLELDHFPPEFIYRFAKDSHIRQIPAHKRPVWSIHRGLHRRSISTRTDSISGNFRRHQRDLFSHGRYYEAILNYTKQYTAQGVINGTNCREFEKILSSCKLIGLINHEQKTKLIGYLQDNVPPV